MTGEDRPVDLTHVGTDGAAHMVDVTSKAVSVREARAEATIRMKPATLGLIQQNALKKGDVLGVARVAGIMAAKGTSQIIPLCHALPLTGIDVEFDIDHSNNSLRVACSARTEAKTGVEMEALVGASVASLTIYDMCKAVDRAMVIQDLRLTYKTGGKSGTFEADRDDSE